MLLAPSTIAHELSHLVAAVCLRVPVGRAVGGKIELFRPRVQGDMVQLGVVPVAQTDPVRSSLIAIAPVLLVPLMLVGLTAALLGVALPTDAIGQLREVDPWRVVVWTAAMCLLPLGAFPSPGDRLGVVGGFGLICAAALALLVLQAIGGMVLIGDVLVGWAQILVAPAAVAGVLVLALRPRRARAPA